MNNSPTGEKTYIQTYGNNSHLVAASNPEPTIKQEIITPMPNLMPMKIIPTTLNSSLNLQSANDSIEYMSNDLDDGNIQGNPHLSHNCSNSNRKYKLY